MSKVVFSSLKTAVKGTALLVVATALSQALWFFIRIIIVRNISQFDFGIYSLSLTILSIVAILFTVGISDGVARYISVSGGESDIGKRKGLIKSAFQILFFMAIGATLALYFLSDVLADRVFDMPALGPALRVISFAVALNIALDVIVAVFRGYGIMEAKAFADIAQPVIYITLLVLLLFVGMNIRGVLYSFVAALSIVVAGVSVYAFKRLDLWEMLFGPGATFRRDLLVFSLPLLGVSLSGIVSAWTDTLMIGYFMKAEDVGLYSVAISLSKLLMFPIGIVNFVFMPIAGVLYAKGLNEELKRTYQVLAKWLFSISFPLFLVLFFFPEMTLIFLFGHNYVGSSVALSLLSIVFMLTTIVGMNSIVLLVIGRPMVIMWIASIRATSNVILNYILIPQYGLTGAALATLTSTIIGAVISTIILFHYNKIHPFTSRYLKPAMASAVIALAIYYMAKSLPLYFWLLPIYFILFICGYFLSILLTQSIEKEDVEMFDAVTDRLGIKAGLVKRIIHRFAHE